MFESVLSSPYFPSNWTIFQKKDTGAPSTETSNPSPTPGGPTGGRRHRTRHRKSKSKRRRTGRKPIRP